MSFLYFLGQNGIEADEAKKIFQRSNNDDEILQCCIQLQRKNKASLVQLISNDKNLSNKAFTYQIITQQMLGASRQNGKRGIQLEKIIILLY